jgi:hypothetical protein
MIPEIIAGIGLAFGALLGLASLLNPAWAAGVVRLVADPAPARPGGFSEFRATYGGLLLLSHTAALFLMFASGHIHGAYIALPFALGWLGAALGRTLSLMLDGEELRAAGMNPIWIASELALGLAIGAPMLHLLN